MRNPGTYGVYAIVNKRTGKLYVGSTKNIDKRFNEHRRDLRKGIHYSKYLQRSWNKDGEAKFEFRLLEETKPNKKALLAREQYWIDKSNCLDPRVGFNTAPKAASMLGYKHTPTTRKKLRVAHLGRILPEGQKRKISRSMKGVVHTKDARDRLSAAHAMLSRKQVENVLNDHFNRGISQPEIAARLGMSLPSINKMCTGESHKKWVTSWLKHQGLKSFPEVAHGNALLTKDEVLEVLDILHAGQPRADIAAIFEVPRTVISNIATGRTYNRERAAWAKGKNVTDEDLSEISRRPSKLSDSDCREIRKRMKQGFKQRDIAKEFDVSPSTICDIKYGRR